MTDERTAPAAGPPSEAPPAADDRTARRAADLLPEEIAAGSADPDAQAAAILADSDEREEHPGAAPGSFRENRTSDETVETGNTPR